MGEEGRRRKISILTYHAIAESADRHTVSPSAFELQMRLIRDEFQVVRLSRLPVELNTNEPDHRIVIVTFDDAYVDFATKAFPILESLRVPSTVFVPTGCVGDHNRWDVEQGRLRREILSWPQIRGLDGSGLVEFGSHTVDHVRMSGLPAIEMRRQAVESKQALEDALGKPVGAFAYPYGQPGDFSEGTSDCLRAANFTMAVTTHWGTRNSVRDLLRLRRIALSSGDGERVIRRKIDGAYDWIGWGQRLRLVRRAVQRRVPA
jgi:peptidoglycan/xylan/chitin deacetylase (PgdA/CDA1 family)